ncbi:TolC family protein [Helicobacter turcicus]|uniref:TolC family protein n=1 Tax=Helicobacter turcicus TaxID=2867412 RepID=A0ABS7JKH1_9HELI|nr:TolC family protein [Helicobacter turcicus]MBX7489890.1 TolC family protein [Helicobacter turcicus]MBX7544750.1 TolC family protein [Helicobacter turcicus]
MIRFLLVLLLCYGIANALSLQEALDLTLRHNPSIKEQEYLLQESRANYKAYQSPFYPSLNLTYATQKSNRIQRADKKTSGNLGGNVQYNLFNGFSDVYNLKSAKALLESQNYQLEATKEDVILLVKSAYIDVLRQAQNVEIAEQSRVLLEEQRRQNAEFYRVGLIQKNDLLKIEVELNNTLQTLLSHKSALNYALRNLERYTRTKIALEDLEELQLKRQNLKFENLKKEMLQRRAELLFMDKIIKSKTYLVQSAKGNFLPEVDVVGDYTRYGDDYALRGRDGIYKDKTNVQLSLSLNLFNGFSDRFKLESAQMNRLAFESQRIALIEDLELQLFSALENYNLALNALEISKLARAQAEENYRISKNRYAQRIESTSDFLDAELSLTQARSKVVINTYAIMESLAQLERITQTALMIRQ